MSDQAALNTIIDQAIVNLGLEGLMTRITRDFTEGAPLTVEVALHTSLAASTSETSSNMPENVTDPVRIVEVILEIVGHMFLVGTVTYDALWREWWIKRGLDVNPRLTAACMERMSPEDLKARDIELTGDEILAMLRETRLKYADLSDATTIGLQLWELELALAAHGVASQLEVNPDQNDIFRRAYLKIYFDIFRPCTKWPAIPVRHLDHYDHVMLFLAHPRTTEMIFESSTDRVAAALIFLPRISAMRYLTYQWRNVYKDTIENWPALLACVIKDLIEVMQSGSADEIDTFVTADIAQQLAPLCGLQ